MQREPGLTGSAAAMRERTQNDIGARVCGVAVGDRWYDARGSLVPAAGDVWYFLDECTVRKGLAYSASNTLILDFGMAVGRGEGRERQVKETAISTAATALRRAVRPERPLNVREPIVQTRSVEPTHQRSPRLRASLIDVVGLFLARRAPEAAAVGGETQAGGGRLRGVVTGTAQIDAACLPS